MNTGFGKPEAHGRRRGDSGFTLVEIMAALAIMSIAMTAVFATFLSQQKSFTNQSRVVEMQQNLRLAADMLVRDIRMAGYGLPLTTGTTADNVALPGSGNPHGITTIRALYPIDNTIGPDQLYIMYLYDMDANQAPGVLSSMPDVYSVVLDNGAANGFLAGGGELVLVTDGITADLFQSTSVTASPPTVNFAAGSVYNGALLHGKIYTAGVSPGAPPTKVAKARFVRYFIQDVLFPDGSAHPTLMVQWLTDGAASQPQPVADDIEDMQLSYGLDTNGDGAVDAFRSTASTAAIAAGESLLIRQVRLTLIARSRMPEKDWIGRRPSAGNRAAAAADDGFRRRTIEVNIDIRNSGT